MAVFQLNVWSILILFGAFLGIYLGAMLLLKKVNQKPNRLFAGIIFIFTLHLIEMAARTSGFIVSFPHLSNISYPFLFLMGPFLYFYALSLKDQFDWHWKRLLHLVPALAYFLWMIPFYILPAEIKFNYLSPFLPERQVEFKLLGYIMGALFYLYNFTYIIITYRTVFQFNKVNHLNKKEKQKISWFTRVLLAYAGFIISCLIFYLIMAIVGSYPQYYDYIHLTLMALMIHLMGYFVMNQPVLFDPSKKTAGQGKYDKSPLPTELSQRYAKSLYQYFEEQQPYLRDDLSLAEAAKGAGLSKHHLSQVLNKEIGLSFYDFVNGYRIAEVKALMAKADLAEIKLIDVGIQAGFGNKVSFYRAFKKLEGMSPSDYLKGLD